MKQVSITPSYYVFYTKLFKVGRGFNVYGIGDLILIIQYIQ